MQLLRAGTPVLALMCWAVATPVAADFTFKRVKPGERSGGRFISIQVEEQPVETAVLPRRPKITLEPEVEPGPFVLAPVEQETKPPAAAGWFWNTLSPSLTAAHGDRLAEASMVLDQRHGSAASLKPPLSRVQRIASQYGAEILKATIESGVSPALVLAVISVESAGRPKAQSHAGAVGLMQLMPATAARFGVTDRTDAAQNIRGGVKYLSWLLNEFNGDAVLALAAYNAGEGAVHKSRGVPNYRETRDYVPKVVAAWQVARSLCLSPPMGARDGCVFSTLTLAQN